MYWTYLRRELAGRKKQTAIVASGLAIAIALVIIVNSLSAGVSDAQAVALQSVYGVGTDLTVSGAQAEPGEAGDRGQFEFGGDDGETSDGTTTLSQSRLSTDMQRGTLDATAVTTVSELDGVLGASGALSLTNITFDGEIPDMSQSDSGTAGGAPGDATEGGMGGPGGDGGSAFNVDSFTVLGIESADTEVGPLSAVEVSDGRLLSESDAGENVALLDSTYATTNELAVGDTIDVGGSDMEIIGLVTSTSDEADTAANVYISIDVAQSLAGVEDVVSTIYVQADSSDSISTVQSEIESALPDATVSSQSDLASTVSSSLSSASSLITNLGTWLSVILLIVAVALAVLFTISGVSRRTREFGTLKAIGWSNRRVVGQVAGESVVQGLVGGVAGLAIGLAGILAINIIGPTISTSSTTDTGGMGGMGGGGMPGMDAAASSADVVLSAPISITMILIAIGLSIVGGLVAGAFGGWRASRLSPAEALRSVG
ncbi:ABC-type antimicrobial peptide transport system permease subunit [Microbacterium halimionae]|uniref:ABC-type antimicrobial peptide transport system permease subunit n=1 Tax=Microbacterium halimionae TaxID=1526413 RepID=A0A7W3JN03_9MICO|nr:ABC transporter permease [Microbacterium halimionae]MBA8815795.1 ABC-type antimicrobial peptide transport system permease subunit [Microbacterium halimionae]NII95841.1 ABC-type antimicrobial peptide transport system permease subunit [Microbacterium halimionae]